MVSNGFNYDFIVIILFGIEGIGKVIFFKIISYCKCIKVIRGVFWCDIIG